MEKTISLILSLLLILAIPIVAAAEDQVTDDAMVSDETMTEEVLETTSEDAAMADKGKPADAGKPEAMENGKPETTGKPLNTGLENALTRVTNEEARTRLEENLLKFQEKLAERLDRLENVELESHDEETGVITLRAEEPVKFFGFIKGKATKRFELDANGNVNERAPWYSLFYSEVAE